MLNTIVKAIQWYRIQRNRCPHHNYTLEPQGYNDMICPVPRCKFFICYKNGNPAQYGKAQQYFYKNKKHLYKRKRGQEK